MIPSSLIYDLRGLSPESSSADVTRVLLQYARVLKDRQFDEVILAYRGTPKFLLKGEYFSSLGREYGVQNPVYTARTFPENVYELDGTPAFGGWTGGLIGVVARQMEDFNQFHKEWYIEDMAYP